MVEDLTDIHAEFEGDRLPPGQRQTDRFPVLSKGSTPSWDREEWAFEVWGAIDEQLSFSYDEFRELDTVTQRQDFHCVTGWSKFDCTFTGVPFSEIVSEAGVSAEANHVLFHALDGYTTDLPLSDCDREGVLLTHMLDGEELPADHGGPLRVVTPHKYAYKGTKWVTGIELLTESERGFWEKRGYSSTANPWDEERYS